MARRVQNVLLLLALSCTILEASRLRGVDDDDDYEHGDAVTALGGDAAASDYTVGQFLAKDDARDGSDDVDDNSKARAQRTAVLAREDHFDSEDTPDPEDSFVQLGSKKVRRGIDDDDDYEHGDAVTALGGDAAASDYSVGQFLAKDDARDGSDDVDDNSKARAQRTAVLAREDHFDSEDTPDPEDSFIQMTPKEKRQMIANAKAFGTAAKARYGNEAAKLEAPNASTSAKFADMSVTAKTFMEVSLGPFASAPEACDYCADSFTKTGQPPAGPVAPACVCMAYPADGGFTMFCATPPSAAGFVKEKGGCRCNPRDMEHMAQTTCEPF